MTVQPREVHTQMAGVVKIAVLALGGQGGGVLSTWIADLARRRGWLAQVTSVAGVAQRTGATIYYIEAMPDAGRAPVFALSPSEGDVDILLAAEMMEAGRAIQRGFVTPDRTVLIASSHRAYATAEKTVPGDGLASSEEVATAATIAAKELVLFDMQKIAEDAGSVISASLFGALGGSGALPFPRSEYEATIRASGRGVDASLKAFADAWALAENGEAPQHDDATATTHFIAEPQGPTKALEEWRKLEARVAALPEPARTMAHAGLRKVVDFLDPAYGAEYMDRLDQALALDSADRGWTLVERAAKYLANAMVYDDVIRVADLKTRKARFSRIRGEMNVGDDHVLHLTEFMHPRIEEVVGVLPAGWARRIEARPRLYQWIGRRIDRGRRVRTDGLFWFGALYLLAGLRPYRRSLRRHEIELEHLERWFALALDTARRDYALGAEILACRRLIKGYSDTHSRGISKFDRVLSALDLLDGREDAADWLRRLREAALQDEKGEALEGALKTVKSFA
ncbi:indolepyruvate oxidoreductase subunit beta family protein [Rhizobiales bacterium]|uniref:indolepyruvate oxidoreductase subunit beta family protein n=1 Tax=Hongsoonwoonella zoysiae TaxID=2821844 RepID=UPI001560FA38|nr:indolepyruvate oxidoreductase subunit beta family protein [Hongsoonwoonella zoysiae]NRG17771.1 indolepyruvate oxidoreductase subunit beta family protein [Hongsoonwoonella zoysiae]